MQQGTLIWVFSLGSICCLLQQQSPAFPFGEFPLPLSMCSFGKTKHSDVILQWKIKGVIGVPPLRSVCLLAWCYQ